MVWACAQGHPVRDGMFVCPVCGSDDVRERGAPAAGRAGAETAAETGSVAPRAEGTPTSMLRATIALGLALVAIGTVSAPDGLSGGGFGNDFSFLFSVAAYFAGLAFLLTGIIGYGVKLGVEASARSGR